MPGLPSGTVTFLFTDIEGSTDLLQRLGDQRYTEVLRTHQRLVRTIFGAHGGTEVDTQGDAFFAAFQSARQAVAAAVAIQRAIATHPWPEAATVRVRTGLHTGEPIATEAAYVGLDVHRAARICAAGWGGQILLSQATGSLVRNDLPPGLTLRDLSEHRLKDLQRPEPLYELLHPHRPDDLPPLRSLSVLPNNLPAQTTSFIGRAKEMAEVARLLGRTRLLTLTGTAGAGKTRLALQVAADLLDGYPDGVWLVELAAIADPALLAPRAAAAMRVREVPGRPILDTLVNVLKPARTLVIMDNCEHLVDACAQFAQVLLQASPGLVILATSREPLQIPGEVVYTVPPLAAPDPRRPQPADVLAQFDAVRLFVDRATSQQVTFRLSAANAPAVAQICGTLDGIPLAIELAAARTAALSVEDVAARLGDRFQLLRGGPRTAPARQQALEAMLDWSYDLLTAPERTLFNRLSIFRGGFTLDAAEGICADGLGPREPLTLLANLVSKSLVVMDAEATSTRYRLLETVRAYGQARLLASGEEPELRRRHRDWYLRLAEQAEPMLIMPDQAWLDRIEAELDNFRAALVWTLDVGEREAARRIAVALRQVWLVRGYWSEGSRWLTAALEGGTEPSLLRARALQAAGSLAQYQGQYERASALAEESLSLHRRFDDRAGMATALTTLGNVAYHRGDYHNARTLHEEGLAYGRQTGDDRLIAGALVNLALIADHQGDYERAAALCTESLTRFSTAGDRRGMAFALHMLGILAGDLGDPETARARHEASLALRRDLGDHRGIASSLSNLAQLAQAQGDHSRAAGLHAESLAIRRELGDRHGIASSLASLALVAHSQGDAARAVALLHDALRLRQVLGDRTGVADCLESLARISDDSERAACLLGAAGALRDLLGAPPSPAAREAQGVLEHRLRSTLGDAAYAAQRERGRRMTLDDAIRYALA